MDISNSLKKFIEDHIADFENNDMQKLFNELGEITYGGDRNKYGLSVADTYDLTQCLKQIDIDPLTQFDELPKGYFILEQDNDIIIPPNIKKLNTFSITDSNVAKIAIQSNDIISLNVDAIEYVRTQKFICLTPKIVLEDWGAEDLAYRLYDRNHSVKLIFNKNAVVTVFNRGYKREYAIQDALMLPYARYKNNVILK